MPLDRTALLKRLGLDGENPGAIAGDFAGGSAGEAIECASPVDGAVLGRVAAAGDADVETVIAAARDAFLAWRETPAPRRGLAIRDLADELRAAKEDLAALVSLEMGKILPEALGEIQEAIDMADFAVGLSRQLYGLSMHSERPGHRLYEQWHPLGPVGVVTAFNFPVAVWAWNAMVALACGDSVVWKPSSKTPLVSVALTRIAGRVLAAHGHPAVASLLVGGGRSVGERILADPRIPLVSATGSCRLGRRVAEVVGNRLGRTLLELGGNNAIVVLADANLDLAVRAILFGAVGTAGQRCTTTRRLLVVPEVIDELASRLVKAYRQVRIGDPLADGTLMGPLVDRAAVEEYRAALARMREEGAETLIGGRVLEGPGYESGCYVEPTLVRAAPGCAFLKEEVFAPILSLVPARDLDHAIALHNDVPQGLSSAIFTESLSAAERFLSASGSDCGIANVNTGTSGAEIGGAFGGEKETGGGREAGSDAWKAYMRRQTVAINHGGELPLAQGIRFG